MRTFRVVSAATLSALALLAPATTTAQAATTAQTTASRLDFSGVMWGNFQVRSDDAAKAQTGGKSASEFRIERTYLTFQVPAGDRAYIRATTDIFQQSTGMVVRLKYGYFNYDLSRNLAGVDGLGAALRGGMLHTVVIDHVEAHWPRYLGISALERAGFFSSADIGVATRLTLPNLRGEMYGVVTNGSGSSAPETDRFKDLALRLTLNPLANDSGFFRSLAISPWYYKGWRASQFVAGGGGQVGPVSDGLQKDRRGIFVGVRDRRLTGGLEFAQRVEELETGANTAASPRIVLDQTGDLYSAFAVARPAEWVDSKRRSPFGLVARLDHFKPDRNTDPYNRYAVLGAFWQVNSNATVALDHQAVTAHEGSPTAPQKTWFLHWVVSY